jgi:CRP/FNR family cyclic AMP-dependent transcriptional regulator
VGGHEDTAFRVRSTYERALAPGETVFAEGDPGDKLCVIQSGEVELTRESASGQRVVARLGAGDFFGELGVVLGKRRTTRAVAVNNVRMLELDAATLEAMCLEQPEIAIRMIRVLVSRLIEAERRLRALGVDDLLRPVVRALVRRGKPDPDRGMSVPTTLCRLSEESGLSMLETHRALHQLFDRRLLHLQDETLVASNVDALTACLDAPD